MSNIPNIGFGTWKLKENTDTTQIIENAISAGYRMFDTASAYLNENSIGEALSASSVSRDELFVSGKLWNADRDNVRQACIKTIENLKCEYLDLYLMHWPASKAVHDNWMEINDNVWYQMQQLVSEGLVRHIGVSNFKVSQLTPLLKNATIKPYVNQIEIHPSFMQKDIIDYCKEQGILVQAWSPLGSGRLLKKDEIKTMAEKYSKTPAQVCLRWCIQNELIPIVKSKNPERMESNLQIFDFELEDEDMKYLNELPYLCSSGLDSEELTLFG